MKNMIHRLDQARVSKQAMVNVLNQWALERSQLLKDRTMGLISDEKSFQDKLTTINLCISTINALIARKGE